MDQKGTHPSPTEDFLAEDWHESGSLKLLVVQTAGRLQAARKLLLLYLIKMITALNFFKLRKS